jgi:hypothetical protein
MRGDVWRRGPGRYFDRTGEAAAAESSLSWLAVAAKSDIIETLIAGACPAEGPRKAQEQGLPKAGLLPFDKRTAGGYIYGLAALGGGFGVQLDRGRVSRTASVAGEFDPCRSDSEQSPLAGESLRCSLTIWLW